MYSPPDPRSLNILSTLDTSPPEKYEILGKISEGGYGIVSKAIIKDNKDAGFFVLKTNKNADFQGIVTKIDLNEIEILMRMKKEKHIVRFIELVRDEKQFSLVFEYCRIDFRKILHAKFLIPLSVNDKKNLLIQLFTGIKAIHFHNVIHRDLKPANVLLSMDGTLKIADFGYSAVMKTGTQMKTDVGTMWYMSPELCLGNTYYNQTVDIWSAGCIAVEFFTRKPGLFQGDDKLTQMEKISELCGFCDESVWPEAKGFPNYDSFHTTLGKYTEDKLHEYLLKVTRHSGAANFLARLLKLNPAQRISAHQAIDDVYFQSAPSPSPDLSNLLKALDLRNIN